MMEDEITYGVRWQTEPDGIFHPFAEWFTNYDDAYKQYRDCLTNPSCIAARIVERTEQFEVVAEKRGKGGR